MSLLPVIELFRLSQKPSINGGVFSAKIDFTLNAASLIQEIQKQKTPLFSELLVDGNDITDEDILPEDGSNIEFTLKLPTSSDDRFYNTIEELIETSRTSRGELPAEFYIINIDYTNINSINVGETPHNLVVLVTICKLIKLLSELAHYHDERTEKDHYKLVFILPNDTNQSQIIVIETKIEKELFDVSVPDIGLLERLSADSAKTNPHYNAQLGVFSVTLIDFVKKRSANQSNFTYLVSNWDAFVNCYQQNLGTYLSGFAFHKAKRDVADAEFTIAEQYSKLISDITGKLFSIPVSLTAIIIIARSESVFESSVLVMGLLLVAALVAGTVDNQQQQLVRICHAKDVVLDALEGKRDSYPEQLEIALQEMTIGLNQNSIKLQRLLRIFRFLAWVPVVAGTVVYTLQYSDILVQILP